MTVDEELDALNDGIRRLKIEYEVFFNGGSKKPPTDLRSRVESLLKKYGDTQKLTPHQRFRYNTLASRFSVFCDLWRTRMRSKEEGSDYRGRYADLTVPPESPPPATSRLEKSSSERVLFKEIVEGPDIGRERVQKLYEMLKECKQRAHESFKLPPLEAFEQFVKKKTAELMKNEKCDRVAFVVFLDENHVRFQASPVRGQE